jgi:hypothetical protein
VKQKRNLCSQELLDACLSAPFTPEEQQHHPGQARQTAKDNSHNRPDSEAALGILKWKRTQKWMTKYETKLRTLGAGSVHEAGTSTTSPPGQNTAAVASGAESVTAPPSSVSKRSALTTRTRN